MKLLLQNGCHVLEASVCYPQILNLSFLHTQPSPRQRWSHPTGQGHWSIVLITGLYFPKSSSKLHSYLSQEGTTVSAALWFKAKFLLWKALAHLGGERRAAPTTLTHCTAAL